ncbi:MAG: ABC transporter substrate-binding protein [Actinobacteria bacterium]|nr:ABC transporter substrate-binding protein [Actinomycetota bacterium]MBV9253163.1 ABC transporter substrate-binding protein [Actinomycetota bacterium]MBV9663083.1 ABC transporter substrate-binding protein [Actinomycetota bacterium]MBV9936264.1 ABC transporter substrate-binding protein [Actinomycetota bacterium]
MPESAQAALRRLLALGVAMLMLATLSAIAVVRADNRNAKNTSLASGNAGSTSGASGSSSGDVSQGQASAGAASASGPAASSSSGSSTGGGSAQVLGSQVTRPGGGSTGGGTSAGGSDPRLLPHNGTDCPDYNPNVGVFCDHYLIGGTTVLSGPLAVYGDQGLKAGQAWLAYYNSVLAPAQHLRTVKLIWYDDNLDPNKTVQYVQRLNEVDHVLYLGGITSPEAASKYIETAKFPMIGDIGLSPKSYTNNYIFPTAPSDLTRDPLRVKQAKERFNAKSFAVIQDVLPSVDTAPIQQAWKNGASQYGVSEADYVEISSTASDCSSQFSRVIAKKPEMLFLPTASAVMLACLREARKFSVQPGSSSSTWLKGWSGGSNLQIEVDNCKPTCEGMLSIGTIFSDPRTSQTPQMKTYVDNMAKYAPNVDITGFIAINYYHTGWVVYNLITQNHLQNSLTRENLVAAANKFGPFDTGFGNIITWTPKLPREPWTCGYPVVVHGDKWVFETQKTCA